MEDLPPMRPTFLHLAGLTDQEFSLAFMKSVNELGHTFSVDFQGLVRQADLHTGEVSYANVPDKVEITNLADKLKLDALEAKFLTGTANPELAAARIEEWGASEIMVTRTEGALVRCRGESYFEPFSNRSVEGRTGRGDTTFGAYLASRLDSSVGYSLRLAASVASIKMETQGPFRGTFEEIAARMSTIHGRGR